MLRAINIAVGLGVVNQDAAENITSSEVYHAALITDRELDEGVSWFWGPFTVQMTARLLT